MRQKELAPQRIYFYRILFAFSLFFSGTSLTFANDPALPQTRCARILNKDTRQTNQQSETETKILNLVKQIDGFVIERDKNAHNPIAIDRYDDVISSRYAELYSTFKKATENGEISESFRGDLAIHALENNVTLIAKLGLNQPQSEKLIAYALKTSHSREIPIYLESLSLTQPNIK